jgi:SAM-dependent methyltransferase
MSVDTDWLGLWRELSERAGERRERRWAQEANEDVWAEKARHFLDQVARRWAKPDSSRTTVVETLTPGDTVLDIGAGAGAWTALLARHARRVTAVDPSPSMLRAMAVHLAAEGVDNVRVVEGSWQDVDVEPHDVSLCAHAMYGWHDLAGGIRKMEAATRKRCFLLMRAPLIDGVMAEASRRIHGHPHDSPSFAVAYNALWQMGIPADVRVEDRGPWGAWSHDTLDEALADAKDRLGIPDRTEHDDFLRDLLERRLEPRDGRLVWPPGVRSALVSWVPRRTPDAVE